jgi:phosphatidylinositol-bisphosphatase
LVSFIDALPRPLLPTELYPSELDKDQQNIRVWARKFLENLPPLHYNVFVYILSFLREVLELREYNRSTNVMLSAIFVAVMTPSSTDLDCPITEREKRASKQEIMQQVISFFLITNSI